MLNMTACKMQIPEAMYFFRTFLNNYYKTQTLKNLEEDTFAYLNTNFAIPASYKNSVFVGKKNTHKKQGIVI